MELVAKDQRRGVCSPASEGGQGHSGPQKAGYKFVFLRKHAYLRSNQKTNIFSLHFQTITRTTGQVDCYSGYRAIAKDVFVISQIRTMVALFEWQLETYREINQVEVQVARAISEISLKCKQTRVLERAGLNGQRTSQFLTGTRHARLKESDMIVLRGEILRCFVEAGSRSVSVSGLEFTLYDRLEQNSHRFT